MSVAAPQGEGCRTTYLSGDGARGDIGARMKGRDLAHERIVTGRRKGISPSLMTEM
jgi:hypothetical protein